MHRKLKLKWLATSVACLILAYWVFGYERLNSNPVNYIKDFVVYPVTNNIDAKIL